MKKLMLLLLSLQLFLTGCESKHTGFIFDYVQIPSVIQEKSEQREYLSYHFWDNIPWEDSTIQINQANIRQPYFEYLSVINGLGLAKAESRLGELAEKASLSSKTVSESFLQLFEESLDHPNSPMRHEKLYLAVINAYIKNLDEANPLRNKLIWDKELLSKNRIGDTAEDFQIVFSDGTIGSLRSIESEYIIIFFFEPDCKVCKESVNYANNSPVFNNFSKNNKIIAVYTGNDISSYEKVSGTFPSSWRVGTDLNNMITSQRLYDRRASPSVYILDNYKKVLMKDGDIEDAEEFIKSLNIN